MRNERGREPYPQADAAQPFAAGDPGDTPAAKPIEVTEDGSATPATEESETLEMPAFRGPPPPQPSASQPGPRLSSGPLENQVINYRQPAPQPHEPAWEGPPDPVHGLEPRPPGVKLPGAAFTHVPWQASDSWGATTLNISANTAAGASYLFWWVSGFLIYFSERNNRFVRFHALQSIILTGGLTIVGVLAVLFATVMQDLTNATHQPIFSHLGAWGVLLLALAIVFAWLCVMIAAWTGNFLRLPIIGPYAERYSAPPAVPTRNPLL